MPRMAASCFPSSFANSLPMSQFVLCDVDLLPSVDGQQSVPIEPERVAAVDIHHVLYPSAILIITPNATTSDNLQ